MYNIHIIKEIQMILKDLLVSVVQYFSHLGHFGIFLAMSLESACIPLPSEVTLPMAGYMVYKHMGTILSMTIVSTLGCLFGSWVAYVVGYYGGRPFILKYGKYIFLSEKELNKADRFFEKRGEITIFLSRMLPVIRTFISLPAGIARMNFMKFSILTIAGSFPWCLLFVYLGNKVGENYLNIEKALKGFNNVIIIGVIALVVFFVLIKVRGKRSEE
jgi:membrane protein DedA with SNARE-associated domain